MNLLIASSSYTQLHSSDPQMTVVYEEEAWIPGPIICVENWHIC